MDPCVCDCALMRVIVTSECVHVHVHLSVCLLSFRSCQQSAVRPLFSKGHISRCLRWHLVPSLSVRICPFNSSLYLPNMLSGCLLILCELTRVISAKEVEKWTFDINRVISLIYCPWMRNLWMRIKKCCWTYSNNSKWIDWIFTNWLLKHLSGNILLLFKCEDLLLIIL